MYIHIYVYIYIYIGLTAGASSHADPATPKRPGGGPWTAGSDRASAFTRDAEEVSDRASTFRRSPGGGPLTAGSAFRAPRPKSPGGGLFTAGSDPKSPGGGLLTGGSDPKSPGGNVAREGAGPRTAGSEPASTFTRDAPAGAPAEVVGTLAEGCCRGGGGACRGLAAPRAAACRGGGGACRGAGRGIGGGEGALEEPPEDRRS